MTEPPFMEHPTGEFASAIAAMEDAIQRLCSLPHWENWITFAAQGEDNGTDSYAFAEARLLGDKLDIGNKPLDISHIIQQAQVEDTSLTAYGSHYSIASASPAQAARILDAVFRHHFGIRPFSDEEDDYAVGAEW